MNTTLVPAPSSAPSSGFEIEMRKGVSPESIPQGAVPVVAVGPQPVTTPLDLSRETLKPVQYACPTKAKTAED